MNPGNIQHPASNAQHPIIAQKHGEGGRRPGEGKMPIDSVNWYYPLGDGGGAAKGAVAGCKLWLPVEPFLAFGIPLVVNAGSGRN